MSEKHQTIIVCDECKGEYTPQEIELKQETLHPQFHGCIETYYNCPHCGHKYTITITNIPIRMKQQQLKKLQSKMRNSFKQKKSETTIRNLQTRIENFHRELLEEERELKNKIELLRRS